MQKFSDSMTFSDETLYSLTDIASQDKSWKLLINESLAFSHKHFLVDNLAIYLTDADTNRLEVVYAKAFGRGKSGEADVSWGESLANQVTQEMQIVVDEPDHVDSKDRLRSPFSLGIPLQPYHSLFGAIIFIRFGGPRYTPEERKYATFLTHQVEAILQKKILADYSEKLKKQTNLSGLQQNFINTISHELRNPLGFIKGYTTTLLREDTQWDTTTQTDFLHIIDRETNHLQELIDDLLDSSRLQSGQMKFDRQLVRLDALIRDEVSRAQVNNPELAVYLDFDPALPAINGDPDRLAQVFDNLINNALKYAPGAEIFIQARQSDQTVSVLFRDTGPGIQEKYLPQVFNRFFRDPEQSLKVHGSGLGLSICKEIIEYHSGKIAASLPAEGGFAITIELPLEEDFSGVSKEENV